MKLHVLDIPEDRAAIINWLEGHLTGTHLPAVVAELLAVHQPDSSDTFHVDDLAVTEILQRGLSGVSTTDLHRLLTHPVVLLDLQEQILIGGGSHWHSVARQHAVPEFQRLQIATAKTVPGSVPPMAVVEADSVALPDRQTVQRSRLHPAIVSALTMAVMLIAINLKSQFWPPGPDVTVTSRQGWGWDRPGALQNDVSAKDYFLTLADSADEWFRKTPETAGDLAVRIAEFRQGCSTLILADHTPLSVEEKTWLVDRCRAWAGKLDQHLTAVESGEPVASVRTAADDTISKLAKALRERAAQQAV